MLRVTPLLIQEGWRAERRGGDLLKPKTQGRNQHHPLPPPQLRRGAGSAEVGCLLPSSAVLNMETSTVILASKHEPPRTHEEPQTNAKNAYVCATSPGPDLPAHRFGEAGSAEVGCLLPSSAVLNMETSTVILASKHEPPRTHEEPQTNAKNAYVCATSFRLIGSEKIGDRGAALTSRLQTFETVMLAEGENFAGLGRLNRALIGKAEAINSECRTVLDIGVRQMYVVEPPGSRQWKFRSMRSGGH